MDRDADTYGVSPDEVDDALEALWHGRSGEFEGLLKRPGADTPGVDAMFGGAVARGLPPGGAERVPVVPNYTILRELGRGGMGIVYEARQQHPQRLVALKVIRGGLSVDAQRVKLFQREVQTLARLKHPNIAALFEAGRTADGEHFFAMELISGVPLTQFARDLMEGSKLKAPAIGVVLNVFCRVCDAINYAHQRGVIHRDLKPSNILVSRTSESHPSSDFVTGGPEVKVLDFGLARVTDVDVAAVTITTDTARVKGTLPYMSPEQMEGDPAEIDIRSDVYSLGVVLYQLLTGRLPFDAKHRSMTQTMRAIREEAPDRPATINRALRGDLETIMLKAIEKEPSRRYQSAASFADDIRRFLARQPVLARPPSTAYQLRKLIGRNRLAFGAGLAVLMVSIVAACVSTLLYIDAQHARQAAVAQKAAAETAREFLVKTFSSIDPRVAQGRDVTLLRDILDGAAERIELELADQPEVRSLLNMVVGQAYLTLGLYERADIHLVRALETRRSLLGPDDPETMKATHNLATLRLDQGKLDEAEKLYRTALEARRRVLGEDHPDTLASMNSLGDLMRELHRHAEAEELLTKTVDLQRRVLGDMHPDTLVSMNNLGNVFMQQNQYAKAEDLFRDSLEAQQAVLPADHIDVLVSKSDLATAVNRQGRHDEAEALYREVAAGFREQLGEGHMDTLIVEYNLGGLIQRRGLATEASDHYGQLLQRAEAHLPAGHYLIGVFRSTYARNLYSSGNPSEALPPALKSFEELKAALNPSHQYVRAAADNVSDIYEALGTPELGEPYRKIAEDK